MHCKCRNTESNSLYLHDFVAVGHELDAVTDDVEEDDGHEGRGGPICLALLAAEAQRHALEELKSKFDAPFCSFNENFR